MGLLWQRLYADFPTLQELPPLDTAEEQFGPVQTHTITVQLIGPQPVPRHWFVSRDGTRVVQVQSDRFILNWRRMQPEEPYPRYEALRQEFQQHFRQYTEFLTERKLGTATVRHAEVNYVNQIQLAPGDKPDALSDVIRTWQPNYGPEATFLNPVEDVRLVERHVITDSRGPFARLYISAEPAASGRLLLNLTMRGRPNGTGHVAAIAFFDMARDRIVRAFTATTTDVMHSVWRRTK